MALTNILRKSLIALVAAAPLAITPSCGEKAEQKIYRLEIMLKDTGRVVGFKVLANTNDMRDTLYYKVKAYNGLNEKRHMLSDVLYAVPVQTEHPDSKGQVIYVHKHLPRQDDKNGRSSFDSLVFEFYHMGVAANARLPERLDIEICPENIPLYEMDKNVENVKNELKAGK